MQIADAEAEAPILWPPNAESQLDGKDPDAGTDWVILLKPQMDYTFLYKFCFNKPMVVVVVVKSLSHVRLFETPQTVAYQVLPSMGFSRQEY